MDHHSDLIFALDAELAGDLGIIDFVHLLNLQEVIAGAEAAELGEAPLLRAHADLLSISARHAAAFLKAFEIFAPAEAVLDCPSGAAFQNLIELGQGKPDVACAPQARGHVSKERFHQLAKLWFDVLFIEVRVQQTNATVDIIAHTTWADDTCLGIRGCDTPDGKPLARAC